MSQLNLSRRALLAALIGSGIVTGLWRHLIAGAEANPFPDLKLPEPGPTDRPPSFEIFLALSQLVTLRQQLDDAVARRMFPLFLDEPWGEHHIHSTYAQILSLTRTSGDELLQQAHPAASSTLGKGQAWFAAHLLTTWYLGIYYHERMPPVRVAYSEALMHDIAHPAIPRRFVEAVGFGSWSSPPT